MTDRSETHWNHDEIAEHLRSAVDSLTPDVYDKIDLTARQEVYVRPSRTVRIYRTVRTAAVAAAACLCVALLGGGVAFYQNRRVDSVIGIDVNPSIELSVNRSEKVLKTEALNEDAEIILDGMDLKNVDLDIAVNALIGSMVRNGYLDELDNAILVTVSNDDSQKASALRKDVVVDIETSLEEHAVEAVVYDQQAPVSSEVRELAKEYGISYGKAYFLQELVEENNLSEEDMEAFAGMTMEEIAKEIAERSYTVRQSENSGQKDDTSADTEEPTEQTYSETETQNESEATAETGTSAAATSPSETRPAETVAETADSEKEEESAGRVRIDYVDYESGILNVVFKEKVKWKNASVSVWDEDGQSYAAKISDRGSDSCEIEISGLPGGMECSFSLAGVGLKGDGSFGSVRGYFETPDIAEELEPEETEETTEPEGESPEESMEDISLPQESAGQIPAETEPSSPESSSNETETNATDAVQTSVSASQS